MVCFGGLMVSVPASGSAGLSSILGGFSNFKSRNVNHENVRDRRSVQKEGGIGAAVGESLTIPRYLSFSHVQYIAFFRSYIPIYISKTPEFFGTVYTDQEYSLFN